MEVGREARIRRLPRPIESRHLLRSCRTSAFLDDRRVQRQSVEDEWHGRDDRNHLRHTSLRLSSILERTKDCRLHSALLTSAANQNALNFDPTRYWPVGSSSLHRQIDQP